MLRTARVVAPGLLLVLGACHRAELTERRELDLTGLQASLLPEPQVRAAVAGEVQGTFAEVRFDFAEPLSLVTESCGGFVDSGQTVSVATPGGDAREYALGGIQSLVVAGHPLGSVRAGLEAGSGEKRCVVTLGSDVLMPYAITIDPSMRTLSIRKTQAKEQYVEQISSGPAQSGPDEFHLIELSRDPNTDWPLLIIRARQTAAQVTGAFLLSMTELESGVVSHAAGEAGLQPRADIFDAMPKGTPRPKNAAKAFDLSALELSPGFGLDRATFQMITDWSKPAVLGVIGSDVWGHFRVTIDPTAGVLLLSRPRVFQSGNRQQCAASEGQLSESDCFQLRSLPVDQGGVDAVVTNWRDAPEGARVYLELLNDMNEPLRSECRVGVSFMSADRGMNARHRFPWAELEKRMPECATQLKSAKRAVLGLYEDGSLRECPGQCGFVQQTTTGRVSCECATGALGISQAERQFLEMYKQLMEKARQKPAEPKEEEPEETPPDDPQK